MILITSIIFKSNYKNNSILFFFFSNDGLPDFNKKKIKNNCFINWYLSKYKTNNKYVYIYTSASKKNYKNYFFIKNFRPSLNFNEFKIFNSEIFFSSSTMHVLHQSVSSHMHSTSIPFRVKTQKSHQLYKSMPTYNCNWT